MSKRAATREAAEKLGIEILQKEILDLEGQIREDAVKAYRKLLLSLKGEPLYFRRS